MFRVVVDTNVVIAALLSQRGASYRLLMMLDDDRWQACVSVPLIVVEYEAVAKSPEVGVKLSHADIDIFLDYVCGQAEHRQIFFLWRPLLPDPGDDCVLRGRSAMRFHRDV